MCDQITIEEINYNQNIMLDVNFYQLSLKLSDLSCQSELDLRNP